VVTDPRINRSVAAVLEPSSSTIYTTVGEEVLKSPEIVNAVAAADPVVTVIGVVDTFAP
jgi:hypothetical protein